MSNINNSSKLKKSLEKRKSFFRTLRNFGAYASIFFLVAGIAMIFWIGKLQTKVDGQQEIISAIVSGRKNDKESFFHAKWMIFEKEQGIHIASASQLDGSAFNTEIVDEFIKTLDPGKVKILRNYTGISMMPFAHILAYYDNEKDLYAELPPPAKIMIVIPASQTIDDYALVRNYKSLEPFTPSSIKNIEKEGNITIISISSLNDHSILGNGVFDGIQNAIIKDKNSAMTSIRSWYKGYMPELKEIAINNLEDVFGVNDSTLLIAYTSDKSPGKILFMLLQRPTGLG